MSAMKPALVAALILVSVPAVAGQRESRDLNCSREEHTVSDNVLDYLRAQFARMDLRFDGVDRAMVGLREDVRNLQSRMSGVESGQAELNRRIDTVTQRLDGLSQRLDRIERRLDLTEA